MITIREAQVEDVDVICEVHVKLIRELCNSKYTDEEINARSGEKRPDTNQWEGHHLRGDKIEMLSDLITIFEEK